MRLTICEAKPHPNSHRAPIPGASGDPANFGCKLFKPATPTEKIVDLATFAAILAALRSLLIDLQAARARRRILWPEPRKRKMFER